MKVRYSVIIVDDEKSMTRLLQMYIKEYTPYLKVMGEANDIESAYQLYKKVKPDLILLDVKIFDNTGFDLIKKINNSEQAIVLITAYEEYALEAYNYNINGYLTKPISPKLFTEKIDYIVSQIKSKENNKIAIKTSDKTILLKRKDVIKLKTTSYKITTVYLLNSVEHEIKKNIGSISSLFDDAIFFRINQSTIINLNYINHVNTKTREVYLSNGSIETVSKSNKTAFVNRISA